MRTIAALIVAVMLPLSFAAPAEAGRGVVGDTYADVCKNKGRDARPGKQSILQVQMGLYRFKGKENKHGKYRCVDGPFA